MARTIALSSAVQDERRIAGAFRSRGAMSGATALPLVSLGLLDSRALRQMVSDTVVRRAGPHRYYLDEHVWAGRRGLAWPNVMRTVVVVALVAMAAALYLYGR